MSTKGRTTFSVIGFHPLLNKVQNLLIHNGYVLLPAGSSKPDFIVFGAELMSANNTEDAIKFLLEIAPAISDIPVLLLSSSDVYSDRTRTTELADKVPMAEHHTCTINSVLEPLSGPILFTLLAEHIFTKQTRTMVLRIFNVYGPDIGFGVVSKWIRAAKQRKPFVIHGSGYQTRSFLHQDDFYEVFLKLVKRFNKGARGIYNVGHDQDVSLKRLAESIWTLTWPDDSVTLVEYEHAPAPAYRPQWKLPDITRAKALVKWKPKISLRNGLWRIIDK